MKSLKFFKPTLAITLAIVLGWLLTVRPAQAGYTVTLQQVGPDVVATGSGAINLTGLLACCHSSVGRPEIVPGVAPPDDYGDLVTGSIVTGAISGLGVGGGVDHYWLPSFGPTSFGSGGPTSASSGSGDIVGTTAIIDVGRWLNVPGGYVSGTFLSDSATYSGKTFATLGVTPGTYVWTWGTGANQNFTLKIQPAPPTTSPATNVASFSATLNGSVNPNGAATTVYFQYGPTTSYGSTTPMQTQTGNTVRTISANITGLTASTVYHFRIVAHNSAGTTYGGDRTFTTLSPTGAPVVTTNPATLIASLSATLNGSVDPHGLTTTFYFQYGTTTSYGHSTIMQGRTGNLYQSVSANISGLSASTTNHFRIVATNSAGTRYGSDRSFTTLSATGAPVVTTNAATNVTSSSATLNGSLDPHGLTTTVYFQYGTTTSYGHTTSMQTQTGNTYRNIAANISGLSTHTTYHFRIVATNSAGTRYGSDGTLTTP
jgi:hypothetical protein